MWSNKQRDGHSLHQVPYRACFKPSLVNYFVEKFSAPGEWVYDPFSGRGTVPLEAALLGRKVIANDLNPLHIHLLEPRLAPPTLAEVEKRLADLTLKLPERSVLPERMLAFFHPDTLEEIMASMLLLRHTPVDRWIRLCILTRLTGHSKGFLSVYTLPPNQAVSVERQLKINEKRGQTPEYRSVKEVVISKTKRLLRDPLPPEFSPLRILTVTDACFNKHVADNSVNLVLTSPPFVSEVAYTDDNWLRNWFIREQPEKLDENHGMETWAQFMSRVIADQWRVLVPGGRVCIEVGNVKAGMLEQVIAGLLMEHGFGKVNILDQEHAASKTSSIWGVSAGTNRSYIVNAEK